MKTKKEKLLISVVSNLVLSCLITLIFVSCFFVKRTNEISQTANSEYNGTIYAGDKNSNKVSLMINVYWGNDSLVKMLDILDKHGVKATFFVGGIWVKQNVDLLKQIYSKGHEIASHGHTHKEHAKLDYTSNLTEIQTCHEIVKDVLKIDMELFAPPGGSYNQNTIKASEFLGYKTIMWTRDTIDWRDHNTSLIYNRAVTNMCGGDLILMHPTENTAEALSNIISYAKKHNFELVTVSENLGV
jgi:peptidoglycan/xylan/chitin deacetylase (PgdA/CDA1 family)